MFHLNVIGENQKNKVWETEEAKRGKKIQIMPMRFTSSGELNVTK